MIQCATKKTVFNSDKVAFKYHNAKNFTHCNFLQCIQFAGKNYAWPTIKLICNNAPMGAPPIKQNPFPTLLKKKKKGKKGKIKTLWKHFSSNYHWLRNHSRFWRRKKPGWFLFYIQFYKNQFTCHQSQSFIEVNHFLSSRSAFELGCKGSKKEHRFMIRQQKR